MPIANTFATTASYATAAVASLFFMGTVDSSMGIGAVTGSFEDIGKYGLGVVLSLIFFKWMLRFVDRSIKRQHDLEDQRLAQAKESIAALANAANELADLKKIMTQELMESRKRGREMRRLCVLLAHRPCTGGHTLELNDNLQSLLKEIDEEDASDPVSELESALEAGNNKQKDTNERNP